MLQRSGKVGAPLEDHGLDSSNNSEACECGDDRQCSIREDDTRVCTSTDGESKCLNDSIIICAGQESNRDLREIPRYRFEPHLIGGADYAGELDAKRAIDQVRASQPISKGKDCT